VHALIRAGWNPPTPDERILDAITSDMRRLNREHYGNAPTLRLSPAEERALRLAAYGLTRPEAAQRVGVSKETIKAQLDSARAKLGARTTTQAVAMAIRTGLID
jgi:LuxR family transcriptional regulator, quorum-sensing system regulator SdiA